MEASQRPRMTPLCRQPGAALPPALPPPLPAGRPCQASSLYHGLEFPFLVSGWFGNPETLLNLSFAFRTMANASNKNAKELKINGDNSLQVKWKHLFCITPKAAKSSSTVQSRTGCLGCQEHAVPLAGCHGELSIHMLKFDGAFFSPTESKACCQIRLALALSREGKRESWRHTECKASMGEADTSELKLLRSYVMFNSEGLFLTALSKRTDHTS